MAGTLTDTPDNYNTPAEDWERYIILAWSIVCSLISLPGNATVFLASARYHAIRLDNISVVVMRNLAGADLVYTMTVISPTICTVLATSSSYLATNEGWSLGRFFCSAQFFVGYVTLQADILLVCTLNISKLTCLLFPLHARTRAKRTGRYISLVIWGCIAITTMPLLLWLAISRVKFSHSSYRCDGSYHASSGELEWLLPIYSAVFGLLPIIIVVVTTAWLLKFVKRVRGLQKESVITNVVVSVVFIVAIVPYCLLQGSYVVLDPNNVRHQQFYIHFYRVAVFMLWINATANPIIYYFSILSFKNFVNRTFFGKIDRTTSNKVANSSCSVGGSRSKQLYEKQLWQITNIDIKLSRDNIVM